MTTATKHQGAPWRNRITGNGEEDPTQLLANPENWRTHPGRQRDAMRGSLKEVGWVQQVIVNTVTGHVVDGHLRVEEAISAGAPSVPVVYVELTQEEERVVLATLDPLGAMAGKSEEALADLLKEVSVGDAALSDVLARLAKDPRDEYTRKTISPRYEPTMDEAPEVKSLYDQSKTDALREVIDTADLDPSVRTFLQAAAARHTRFDYSAIAEFYAHAPANVQRLMEASALVLVDLNDAIRDGYVRWTETISSVAEQDDAEAEG